MRANFSLFKYLILSFLILAGISDVSALNPAAAEKYFKSIDFSTVDQIKISSQSGGNKRVQFSVTKRNAPRIIKAGKHALWITKPKINWRMIVGYDKIVYVHHESGGHMYIIMQ